MNCMICGNNTVRVIYNDYIRDGEPNTLTSRRYEIYQCEKCNTIWHEINKEENAMYYQSRIYRERLEKSASLESYQKLHDKEVLEKLEYTGTDIYRNAISADIGCGGGSFLDFISGVASKIIAIEPSEEYRSNLKEKNYNVFAYAKNAIPIFGEKVDVVTSFDVIEHVENPINFMQDVYDLLHVGGKGIIGTPSDCPVMRQLLGKVYEQKLLYSYQHPWILSIQGFELCCRKAGFSKVTIRQKQRYGLGNLIAWLADKEPVGLKTYDFISQTLNNVYQDELEKNGLADYLIAYVEK